MNEKEFDRFVKSSVKELNAKQDALMKKRGMATFDNFEVDLALDELVFYRGKQPALRAKILIVGTHVEAQEDWLWAWANSGLSAAIRKRSAKLKQLSKLTGEKNLSAPNLSVNLEGAWELVAMACKHLGGVGAYTFPNRDARIYVLILELEDLLGKKTAKKKKKSAAKKKSAKKKSAPKKKRAAKKKVSKRTPSKKPKKSPKRRAR